MSAGGALWGARAEGEATSGETDEPSLLSGRECKQRSNVYTDSSHLGSRTLAFLWMSLECKGLSQILKPLPSDTHFPPDVSAKVYAEASTCLPPNTRFSPDECVESILTPLPPDTRFSPDECISLY